ncbi:diacylglycerol kinase family protein [Flavobacterium paronense]|uniref:Diacylglycerol/lipid kinase family protein n=1 Tax=Flavobacterium paronense TaxID=1392775 RepID=A0ABV5GCQ7_9FLAO|nr:diacylglycerol kinase family protein [Flavobacterium paronense]MDN3676266.1 diacylglycerol kinase family protein [Flavobacterium paronense]
MKKNIIIVVNPVSGAFDKSETITATLLFAKKEKLQSILYETSGKNDVENIKKLYNLHKPERIIIIGGDGTIRMVAEAIAKEAVVLGIIPAGSANGFALDLDLNLSLEENLEIAFLHHFIEIDVITINEKISLHLSDIGLNAELIKNYEQGDIHGKLGYALHTISTLFDSGEPFTAKIKAKNTTYEYAARMIIIANAKKYGTGVVINPNGVMNDGKFELVILKNFDLIILGQIIYGNMPLDSDDVEIISTNEAIIELDSPVSFQMDGEYCGAETNLDIKILHKQLKVAIP